MSRRTTRLNVTRALLALAVFTASDGQAQVFTNRALTLNGSGAYARIPSSDDLQNPTQITVEAWLFPTNNGKREFFINKGDGINSYSDRSYELVWEAGLSNRLQCNVFIASDTWGTVDTSIPEAQWSHVAFTYQSTNGLLAIYTNGLLAASRTVDAGGLPMRGKLLRQSSVPLCLGNEPLHANNAAAGRLDEVRIWNVPLSGSTIAARRFCRLAQPVTNLMAGWHFDGGIVTDLAGRGNNGTLMGGATISMLPGVDPVHNGECGARFDPTASQFHSDVGFRQRIHAASGATLIIETTTNLANWAPLFIIEKVAGPLDVVDPTARSVGHRFYRVRIP